MFRHVAIIRLDPNLQTLHFKYLFKYSKNAAELPFFSLQNAVYFIMLPCLVPVLFTF
jgi:hypothetical protein